MPTLPEAKLATSRELQRTSRQRSRAHRPRDGQAIDRVQGQHLAQADTSTNKSETNSRETIRNSSTSGEEDWPDGRGRVCPQATNSCIRHGFRERGWEVQAVAGFESRSPGEIEHRWRVCGARRNGRGRSRPERKQQSPAITVGSTGEKERNTQ